jgi:hypothetical protein
MSRPQPKVLLAEFDNEGRGLEVCAADAVYAVCYQGHPVSIRKHQNIEVGYPGPKYVKSNFSNPGHAFNLAEKLNARFDTTDFTIIMMSTGRTIKE